MKGTLGQVGWGPPMQRFSSGEPCSFHSSLAESAFGDQTIYFPESPLGSLGQCCSGGFCRLRQGKAVIFRTSQGHPMSPLERPVVQDRERVYPAALEDLYFLLSLLDQCDVECLVHNQSAMLFSPVSVDCSFVSLCCILNEAYTTALQTPPKCQIVILVNHSDLLLYF